MATFEAWPTCFRSRLELKIGRGVIEYDVASGKIIIEPWTTLMPCPEDHLKTSQLQSKRCGVIEYDAALGKFIIEPWKKLMPSPVDHLKTSWRCYVCPPKGLCVSNVNGILGGGLLTAGLYCCIVTE